MIAKQVANQYDVVVVGAGPAGCTAAALIAEQGHSTLLVERDKLPRFHVGESLMPETYHTLTRLGVWDKLKEGGYVKKNGVQFVNHQDKESRPFFFAEFDDHERANTFHVERRVFDQLLFENAMDKGAQCLDSTRVTDISAEGKSPHTLTLQLADKSEQKVVAKVVVDATGQSAMIANRLGLVQIDPELKKAAIWGYFEDAERNGPLGPDVTCILHTDTKDAWFWYIPIGNGTVSVGVVSDNERLLKGRGKPEEIFAEERDKCPGLQRRLENAKQVGDFRVAKEFSYSTKEHAGDGWVLIGDAYGFIDPIYSSGVFLALKSGEMAADAIHAALEANDVSAEKLGTWFEEYDAGAVWIRKLVHAFYTHEFSFGEFMKEFPQHGRNLTDLLVGKVYDGEPGRIFDDMDPWIKKLMSMDKESESMSSSS